MVIRCSSIPDSKNYLINDIEVVPQEAQVIFNQCKKDDLLVYASVTPNGVWTATSNVNHGRPLPKDLERWKA